MKLLEHIQSDPCAVVLHLRALVENDEPMDVDQLAAWFGLSTATATAKLQGCPAYNQQKIARRFRPSVARPFLVGVPAPAEDWDQ